MKISEKHERWYQEALRRFKEEVSKAEPNTFQRDHGELLVWHMEETHKIHKTTEWSGGLDGEHTMKMRELHDMYISKVNELKKKYGIEV